MVASLSLRSVEVLTRDAQFETAIHNQVVRSKSIQPIAQAVKHKNGEATFKGLKRAASCPPGKNWLRERELSPI